MIFYRQYNMVEDRKNNGWYTMFSEGASISTYIIELFIAIQRSHDSTKLWNLPFCFLRLVIAAIEYGHFRRTVTGEHLLVNWSSLVEFFKHW